MNKVIIFSAPSGSGKTTLVKHCLEHFPELEFSISCTTRNPRGTEKDGVDYHFISPEKFRQKIWEEAFPNNPDAVTMKNLADAYRTQGRYPDAELIYLKSLKIIINESKIQPSGSFYDGLFISIYKGLSALYWATGRESEAEAMDRQVNRIKSKEN